MAETELPEGFQLEHPVEPAPAAAAPQEAHSPETQDLPPGFELESDKYGSLGQTTAATAEAAARAATLGGSTVLERALGVPAQDIEGRERQLSPAVSIPASMLGAAIPIALTGGVAAPAEGALVARGVAPLAARAIGFGAEGALFGAGNVVNDAALGDPNLNAQKILQDVGFGFATSAGLGVLSKALKALPVLQRAAEAAPKETAPVLDAPGTPQSGVTPATIEDIASRVEKAKASGESLDLPQKAVLQDALSRVEMDHPVHPLQFNSLDNQAKRDLYKSAQEIPGKVGESLKSYEALQKNELLGKTAQTIRDLSPEIEPTSDAVKGGERAIDAFTQNYNPKKNALAPVFEAFKSQNTENPELHLPGMIEAFTNAIPGVSNMLDTSGADLEILPYKTAFGIDHSTYNAVKEAVESLKDNPETVQGLLNIRSGLKQHVNVLEQGSAPAEIRALRAAAMDYIQKAAGNDEIRELLKRYAINEQQRGVIEKVFGASVGSPEFGAISKVKPENIGDRIFSNTAAVSAAKQILPKEKFNQILANWLSEAKQAATDKGAFSSNKFASFLKRNQDALNEAFSENPASLQRLKDLTTIMRILPDSPPINPSGTAKTLLSTISHFGEFLTHPEQIPGKSLKHFSEMLQKKSIQNELEAALAGKSEHSSKLNMISKILKRSDKRIDEGVKGIFGNRK